MRQLPTIVSVVGARPNFMKMAPVSRALTASGACRHVVIHTGQHHDPEMSDVFFEDLGLAPPHHSLDVGSGSHAQQTAGVMCRIEPILQQLMPAWVVVYGDVNSTLAAALTATKLGIRVAHVEAGLRSRDRSMPEEINRILTDHTADLRLAPSPDAVDNLIAEGIPRDTIRNVGNVMIDSLCWALPQARGLRASRTFGLEGRDYAVVTMHRPGNVDDPNRLADFLHVLSDVSRVVPIVFPVHPRTRKMIGALRNGNLESTLQLIEPVGYLQMLSLVAGARLVITDSGGVQEETTFLGVPCLTVRPSTERPITCTHGTNQLVPEPSDVLEAAMATLSAAKPATPVIDLWDGHAADRIAHELVASCVSHAPQYQDTPLYKEGAQNEALAAR